MNWIRQNWDCGLDILCYVIGLFLIIGLFFIYDAKTATNTTRQGHIYESNFSASNMTTTTGMAMTSKGVAPVIATSGHGDEYYLIVNFDSDFDKIKCSINEFYTFKHGDNVTVTYYYGGITGINYYTHLTK